MHFLYLVLQFSHLLERNKTSYLTEVSTQAYRKKYKAVWKRVLQKMKLVLLRGRETIIEKQIAKYLQIRPAKGIEEGGECSRQEELKGQAHLGSTN